MAEGLSNYLANALADTLRGEPFAVAETWLGLYTGNPGSTGSDNISAGCPTRTQITFSEPADGSMSAAGPTWANIGGVTETVTHIGLFDGASRFLCSAALVIPRVWEVGDTLNLGGYQFMVSARAAD